MNQVPEHIVVFLRANQWSAFYRSLLYQYESKGTLSPRQIETVVNAINRKAQKLEAPQTEKTFSLNIGQVIEVKAWIARRLQADLGMKYFFRNLEVIQVMNESAKAYQLKIKFVSRIVTSCHICGKELDTEISRATGIGPVCAHKLGLPRPTLETAKDTLKSIDELCQRIGEIGPIWVPKSQIKTVENSENIPKVGA